MSIGRVLLLHYTPPGIIGGVEHIMEQHMRLLEERGYTVEIVAGRPGPIGTVHVIPEIDAALNKNLPMEADLDAGVVTPEFHRKRDSILRQLTPLFDTADTVIVHNAFTLHFSIPLTAALWQLAGRLRSGPRILAWCHDLAWVNPLYIPGLHPGYPWDLLRWPAPGVRYITVSAERRHELLGLWDGCGEDVTVVPNGVDVWSFLRISQTVRGIVELHRLFDRQMVLLLPVRITRRKNIELGIRVIRALKDRGVDVVFLISGPQAPHHPGRSDMYLHKLQALRHDMDVEAEVVFVADELGRNLEDEEVVELYGIADALLFPSASEGFGLPILEASLVRMPAIVSDIPIFHEVGGGDVWTFGLQVEVDRIAGEIVSAQEIRPVRLRRRVVHEYRWDAVLERHILPLLHSSVESPSGQDAADRG